LGGLAQLGEHLPYKQRVGGSIPSSSTINISFVLFLLSRGGARSNKLLRMIYSAPIELLLE
jgi:hypothetical protein